MQDWQKKFPWLRWNVDGKDNVIAFCVYCFP